MPVTQVNGNLNAKNEQKSRTGIGAAVQLPYNGGTTR